METIEGNKLIAEFVGLKVDKDANYNVMGDKYPLHVETKYHSSWDWLMPVVEKIEKQGVKIEIEGTGCDINRLNPFHPYNNGAACDTKIESVWLAIVQFIQWYNTTKPQPNATK